MLTEEHKKKIAYLSQYKTTDKKINQKLDEIQGYRDKAEKVTTVFSTMPMSRTGKRDKVGDNACIIVDKIKESEQTIYKEINQLLELKKDIENKIDQIKDENLKLVMKDKYILSKTWEEIAFRNNYSWQHVYKLHEKALDQIKI